MNSIVDLAREWAKPAKILIVEDEPEVALILQRYLSAYNVDVDVAPTAYRAKELVAARVYDLVFIDLLLSDEPGTEVIHAIRAKEQKTPVVVISGCLDAGLIEEAHKLGLVTFLRKPYDFKAENVQSLMEMFKVCCRPRSSATPDSPSGSLRMLLPTSFIHATA